MALIFHPGYSTRKLAELRNKAKRRALGFASRYLWLPYFANKQEADHYHM